jgi:competence protein ComEC
LSRVTTPIENAFAAAFRLGFRFWAPFVLTLVLQIGMLPLMAGDFHRITLDRPLVNLVAVPLIGLIVPLGFVATTSALLAPAVGKISSVSLQWLTVFLLRSIASFAHFPNANYRIPSPRPWLTLTFFLVAIVLAVALRLTASWQHRTAQTFAGALIFCACLGALFPFSPRWLPGKLDATILDVGQGDAIFVVSPQGQTLLIDGGERLSRTSRGILEKKRSQRICGPGAFGSCWSGCGAPEFPSTAPTGMALCTW